MKAGQMSFAAGEISPLLHARVDLSKYHTALAELVNMIVLPQGGVTRRAGFTELQPTFNNMNTTYTVKLIPFEYNTTDSELIELGNKSIRIWQRSSVSDTYIEACTISSPYSISEVKDLRYVQSGNVMFLTHRNYKPMMLKRNSLTSWTLEELPFRGGPWIDGEEWASGVKFRLTGTGNTKVITGTKEVFTSGLGGTLMKVEYAVAPKTITLTSQKKPDTAISEPFVVKGTLNVTTSGTWVGLITVDRSVDGGNTWITVRQYRRMDVNTQGQWDFTLSETEDNVLYRITAQHEIVTDGSSSTDSPGGGSQGSGGSSDTSWLDKYSGHPDVEGGENYVYLTWWIHLDEYSAVYGDDINGKRFYYKGHLHQTFYLVGEDSLDRYGYVIDGYPDGYDENGNKTW